MKLLERFINSCAECPRHIVAKDIYGMEYFICNEFMLVNSWKENGNFKRCELRTVEKLEPNIGEE